MLNMTQHSSPVLTSHMMIYNLCYTASQSNQKQLGSLGLTTLQVYIATPHHMMITETSQQSLPCQKHAIPTSPLPNP